MNSKPAVVVKNVYKYFPRRPQLMRRNQVNIATFISKRVLHRKASDDPFVALKDVSFTVNHGESVGIIGYNGAGKSTILRIITGITVPTAGSVEINGKYGELFALNAGFNAQLSGRKNIYLIAAIKGFSKVETDGLIDQIVEFSELGDFIDQPVKVYSSGMRGRLGFSILIHLLPDIIFIDEALAAGDKNFQMKCQMKLNELVEQNKTLIIVSHSLSNISDMCTRVIWMDHGEIIMDGPTKQVLNAYKRNKNTRNQHVDKKQIKTESN